MVLFQSSLDRVGTWTISGTQIFDWCSALLKFFGHKRVEFFDAVIGLILNHVA